MCRNRRRFSVRIPEQLYCSVRVLFFFRLKVSGRGWKSGIQIAASFLKSAYNVASFLPSSTRRRQNGIVINVLRKDSIMNISSKMHRIMLLGSLPTCLIAMILFREPSSDQPLHDMPGGANRFINRSRTIRMPLPVAERGYRYVGRRGRRSRFSA